jgi:hypothetical protein
METKRTKRQKLANKAKSNLQKIEKLTADNRELLIKSYLLCDNKQQYKEDIEVHGKGKNKRSDLVGRIYWTQLYEDQSTGEKYPIERSETVRINGEWQC